MRKIKKIVTLLLTLVFVASNTIYSFANENSTLSSDVPFFFMRHVFNAIWAGQRNNTCLMW